MTRSRLTTLTIRTTTLCALIAGVATAGYAQRAVFVPGLVITKRVDASPARVPMQFETLAWNEARIAPDDNLDDIEVAPSTQVLIDNVKLEYSNRLAALWNEGNDNTAAGYVDQGYVSRIDGIRLDQREALRCELTPSQQVVYDRNVRGNMTPVR